MFHFLRRWFPKPLTTQEQELLEYLGNHATLFGSRLWGGSTSSSDYDFYLDYEHHKAICSFADSYNISNEDHDQSRYEKFFFDKATNIYLSDGRGLQLLSYTDSARRRIPFRDAITLMTAISQSNDMPNKQHRYSIFEACVDITLGKPTVNTIVNDFAHKLFPELFI